MALLLGQSSGVAVLEMHGIIGTQVRVPIYSRILEDIARSKRYKALLLDIDSPGGSASGSEVLYRGLQRVAENKPVYAYIRGIGASGGYYLCCAASQVISLPTALVGSIGVIYMRPVLEQLLSRVGIEFSIYKSGRLKDMTGFWRQPTVEESTKFQELIDEIYDNFVSVVARARRLNEAKVRELATGEVVTALRGLEVGLVDQIGDFEDALNAVAEAGKTKPRPKWLHPKRGLAQKLMGRSAGQGSFNSLAESLHRVLTGGIYYLEPSHLLGGEYPESNG